MVPGILSLFFALLLFSSKAYLSSEYALALGQVLVYSDVNADMVPPFMEHIILMWETDI